MCYASDRLCYIESVKRIYFHYFFKIRVKWVVEIHELELQSVAGYAHK